MVTVFGIAPIGVLTVSAVASAAPPTASITNLRFVNLGGGQGLALQGVLNGTLTSVTGAVTSIVNQAVTLPVSGAVLFVAAISSAAVSTACRGLVLTLTHPLVLFMELRARRDEAAADVIKRLAHLLIGRVVPICHGPSIDRSPSFYA